MEFCEADPKGFHWGLPIVIVEKASFIPAELIFSTLSILCHIVYATGINLRLKDIGEQMKPAPIKPDITFDDLQKIDIRVGTIESVDSVESSKKLVKLIVNFGDHTRTILAGIKQEREDPREITGRQALFVVNIPPRRMAGEESQGMLFDLGYEDGVTPALAVPESMVPNGTRAG